jgi:hypothetical protein
MKIHNPMKKLITVCQALVIAAIISTLAFGADQVIKFDENMVGRGHPTLADTLNRGFLIQHNPDGTHSIVPWSAITGTPTTLSGYGITDGGGTITTLNNGTMDNTRITRGTLDNATLGNVTPIILIVATTGTFSTLSVGAIDNATWAKLSGLISNVQTQLNGKQALDNGTFTGEVQGSQFVSTGGDNTHFVQVGNTGAPPIPATDNAGIIWFQASDNTIKVTSPTGAVGTVSVSW